ncbi:lipoprotein [Streptomyces hygroscopicus subsp. jinggangensis 5008]|nr:lipoprotein [Streptomyces hygroscopicus subsp. jinggangensis 5008]AGF60065.1 lipoprotein [Streptomyces hygroscopicus subsp. jinggangensis TL01]
MLFGKRTRRTRLLVAPAALSALSAVALIGVAAGPSQAAARPGWADTSALSVRVHALDSGAGQRYATVILTNKTHKTVRTQGYVGLQLLDAHGKDVPTHVVRDRGRAEPITLKPGQSAYTRLHWGVVAGTGEPTKAEKDPTRLEVTPPDSRSHLNTAWKLGEVLQKGRIDITPLAKGTGPRF